MRLKIWYNTSSETVEILEHDPGQAFVKVESVDGDEIILLISTTEEQYGSVHKHTVGEL
jgi:hypothetical protein